MADHKDREHFLPVRKTDLIDLLCRDVSAQTATKMSAQEIDPFRRFCTILSAYYHHEYHQRLEELQDAYSPFDPDRDTRILAELTEEQRRTKQDELFRHFGELMQRGNLLHLTHDQIQAATREVTAWGINLDVDFNVFERMEIYVRGEVSGTRPLRKWYKPWVTEDIPVRMFKRLVLILKQKPHKRLGKTADTRSVFLKYFKDIPKVDLEMLLPGGRPKMPALDRGKLGASMASAIGFVLWKVVVDFQRLGEAIVTKNPLVLYGPLSMALGYGYKQYAGYQYTKKTYASRLTESLYYQNLDSNGGVLNRLLDEAEEQDCREAILAYFHLWRNAPTEGWTADQLDEYIELDLEKKLNLKVDFEVDDAVAKLERLKLVRKNGDRYTAIPIDQAMRVVDEIWDNIFPYNG